MLPNLKTKIKNQIENKSSFDEPTVLYILIQSRKVMELTSKRETLLFYCNWVAHTKIDRKSSFTEKLKNDLKKININTYSPTLALFGFVSLKQFRSDFKDFIKKEIDLNIDLDKIDFNNFEEKLKLILQDIKIEININKNPVEVFLNQNDEFKITNLPNAQTITIKIIS